SVMGEEWLGRVVDANLVVDLEKAGNITPCGEAGEYHTLVIGGPIFKKDLEVSTAERIMRDNHWYLDIKSVVYMEKEV
ncbi:MAG: ATP-binding protein, partial [Dehalococcoidales bacterium]|nr:ATP-binding protein [Dehalococcoidales bacterium]